MTQKEKIFLKIKERSFSNKQKDQIWLATLVLTQLKTRTQRLNMNLLCLVYTNLVWFQR